MSLITMVSTPFGIAVSADSRSTGIVKTTKEEHSNEVTYSQFVLTDTTNKLFIFNERFVVGIFGSALIEKSPTSIHIEQFGESISGATFRDGHSFASAFLEHFRKFTPRPDFGCIVACYENNRPYMASIDVGNESIKKQQLSDNADEQYGLIRAGDTDVVDRLLCSPQHYPKFEMMSLADAIDYSRYLITASAEQMKYEPRPITIGGPIDTVLLTTTSSKFLFEKNVTGNYI